MIHFKMIMSADASYNILQSHSDGHVALPQPVGDLSLIDSVTGFIQEAYVNVLPAETKLGDKILWAKFVPAESSTDVDSAPLILVLAYSTGVQAWSINTNGEAKEVLSWHQGIVKAFQFLPCPSVTLSSSQCTGRDMYMLKRPLIALCDNGGPSPPFHNVTFLSLATGEQVKHIKFKNEVCEILANKKCILVTFGEKIAIFDTCSLEDRFTITTCYPSPGIKCNPVSLGSRWLAFADTRILSLCRSYGGYEGEGAVSYTASVLEAAKYLRKGLRDLGGSVAHSLTGSSHNVSGDVMQDGSCPGIVTVLDIESKPGDSRKEGSIVAHFVAHTTPIVALSFDPTGLLLLTVEKRGHKFNLFRIEPSKSGSSHATVHHLYILHRGDTTARVQDITFSSDSRWVAVSSLRGTTHVFPITMYGGGIGLRTHTTPHVVNRLSRFHKSAGITPLTPSPPNTKSPPPNVSSSPDLSTSPSFSSLSYLHPSTPLVLTPLAQIRRQLSNSATNSSGHRQHSTDDSTISVKVAACFAPPKCSSLHPSPHTNHLVNKLNRKSAAPSLFLITGHGYLIQYDLDPRPIAGLTKDKLCDDTPVDLHVEARCQWRLFFPPTAEKTSRVHSDLTESLIPRPHAPPHAHHDKWLSQVEIITHAGPHRRLWMGPQVSFKTYTPPTSGEFSFDNIVTYNVNTAPSRSTPMNIDKSKTVPVLIETVSTGSSDQSPRFMEEFEGGWGERMSARMGDTQLCEDLADAMQETHSVNTAANQGVSGSSRVVWVTELYDKSAVSQREDKLEPLTVECERKVEVLCRLGVDRASLVYVRKQDDLKPSVQELKEDTPGHSTRDKEKAGKRIGEKKIDGRELREKRDVSKVKEKEAIKAGEDTERMDEVNENSLRIVEDLFSAGDESEAKKNRKTKKKERKNSREENTVKSNEEKVRKTSVGELISLGDYVELRPDSKVEMKEVEVTKVVEEKILVEESKVTETSVEGKKKSKKTKKAKEAETAAEVEKIEDKMDVEKDSKKSEANNIADDLDDKMEDVDESLFEENIDIAVDQVNHMDERQSGEDTLIDNRCEGMEDNRFIEVDDNRYGLIDSYEETYDDLEPVYQYEEEYDPYDEELAEAVGNVYIQGDSETVYIQGDSETEAYSVSERLSEPPPLLSEFPAIQSFDRPPALGLEAGVDSGCGLKKRKNKKKKR